MTMQRKTRSTTISAALLAGTLALALTGCQQGSGAEDRALSVWLPPFAAEGAEKGDLALWQDIVAPFAEEHDVEVDITIVPWESFETRFLTGFSSGDGPDLGYMYAEMIGDYISRGQLASYEPYLEDADTDAFYFLDQGLYDGEQYGLPIVVGGARVVFYNNALLSEAGITSPPETWDDLVDAALQVEQNTDATGLAMAWGEGGIGVMAENYVNFLWQAGGELVNEDGTAAAFNSEEGLKAAQFISDLRFEHGLLAENTTAMNRAELQAAFAAGEVAFAFGNDGDAPAYQEAGLDIGAVVLTDEEQYSFVATDVLVMAESSKNKELATELALFMLSGPSMDSFNTVASYPPISSEQTSDVNPLFADLYSTEAEILRQYPAVPNSSVVYTSLYENLQQMLLGQKTAQEALAAAESAANEALAQNAK